MRQRFYSVTAELLDSERRVVVVLADIGYDGFRAAGALRRHRERVINVGIREALMVAAGAGMALEGMRPVMHSYAPFLVERAWEQVKLDFGHQGVAGILASVGASYDWAQGGRTHHAPEDVALIGALPGWTVHVPGHPDEVEHVLRAAAGTDEPVYLRLAEDQNAAPVVSGCGAVTAFREADIGAPAILAVGPMLDRVVAAADELDATILYTATARPLDIASLRRHVTGPDVVIVEPYLQGTSAGEVTAALKDRAIRLLSIGVPQVEHRHYGSRQDHDRAYGLDVDGLRERLRAFAGGQRADQRVPFR